MSTRQATAPSRLSDTQLVEMMSLIGKADSVELKLTIPEDAHRATITNLALDPVEAEPRQVFFFDTPNLDLDKPGVVVRARRRQGGVGDTVIKLRPVKPDELPKKLRKDASFKVEVDAMPGGFVCSGSFKGRTTGKAVRNVVSGAKPLQKLFSKEQRAFFATHAPEGIEFDALVPLGPTFILKGTFSPSDMDRPFVAEYWLYQDGSRILELSTKCTPAEAFQVAAEARAYLMSQGVKLGGNQQAKTRTALEFFRGQLAVPRKSAAAAKKPASAARKPASSTTTPAASTRKPATRKRPATTNKSS